ncbi:aminoacyl-tRNA hydrolase [uncultured Devosia sp.]|uniref:aminoacyl-tRNA hydrolase n=1 Tax=uncultured Devosia sp. TaxID=211434 RepID=UPI0035C98851
MKLLVGLGNAGDRYRHNRHNIGFMAADAIHREYGFGPWKSKYAGLLSEGQIAGERVLLLKPQTMMNLSGNSVQQVAQFHRIAPIDVSVLYDELDLAPGKVRVKIGGGNGGHNGLRSIDPQLGLGYRRVRLGIGHPGNKDLVIHHVLGDFAKSDQLWLEPLLDALAKNAALLVVGDDNGFMNKIALATQTAAEPAPAKAQSHIRQARPPAPQATLKPTGPMAAMLDKLFKKD